MLITLLQTVFFYIHSWILACCDTNKTTPKILNFTNPKLFESAETPGVGRLTTHKQLYKDCLAI